MVFTTDVKEETLLGPTVVYSALASVVIVIVINVLDVIDVIATLDVIEKALQMHLLIYHPLHVKCLPYDNVTSITYNRSGKYCN